MATVCFTGHRCINEALRNIGRRLERAIEKVITEYMVTDFYVGGAVGFDMIASQEVIKAKNKHGTIRLHLILPCPIKELTVKWNNKDIAILEMIIEKSDSVEIVSDKYYDGCMKARNKRLIDCADSICICYYNENDRRSGTGQTYRMAKEKGLRIINLYKT